MDARRLVGKFYIRSLEEAAFVTQLARIPVGKVERLQDRTVRMLYSEAKRTRGLIGETPKQYKMIKRRKIINL